jgi:hypothetical protein
MTKAATSYSRLHHNSDLPPEDGIYAYYSDDGTLVRVISLRAGGSHRPTPAHMRRPCWAIFFYPTRVVYRVKKNQDDFILTTMKDKESFLEGIAEAYPEHLQVFIWHPDLLSAN